MTGPNASGPSPAARRPSTRVVITLFGTCLIAAAWANVGLRSARERESEVQRCYQENGALVRAFEEHVRRVVQTADGALLFLQSEYETRGGITQSMKDFVARAKDDPILAEISVADARGDLVLSSVPYDRPINCASREHFRLQAESASLGLHIGKPIVKQVSGQWAFFLSRRLNRPDGAFGGIVSVALAPEYFSAFYADPRLGPERATLLAGRDEIVRVRHFRQESQAGLDLGGSALFQRVREAPAGHYDFTDPADGLPRYGSYSALADYPLVVSVASLQETALAPYRKRAQAYALGALVFTLFTGAFCALLMRAEERTRREHRRVAEELTQRLQAEQALRESQEERLTLERQVQQAQKMESLGILAGGIAHDFNNLLMAIMGNVELALRKAPTGSPLRLNLERADTAAQRAAGLTSQMLAYSGKGHFLLGPVDLSNLVREMEPLLATVISKRATFQHRLAAGLPPVLADETQLRQVVMNLITNASEALGDKEGTVVVTTGIAEGVPVGRAPGVPQDALPEGRYVYLEVADDGCGMDLATQSRVFDPFFTTKEAGRGLGLAALLGIVRGHRGAIELRSQPGRGSVFKVYFPADGTRRALAVGPRAWPEALVPATAGRQTVLVVDDEEGVRSVVREMMEAQGFAVLTAADGREAVEVFRGRGAEISAVILDLTMPRMGGEEALRELRKIREDVPVILASGYGEDDAKGRFQGPVSCAFVQKPYRAQALRAALAEVLERPPRQAPESKPA